MPLARALFNSQVQEAFKLLFQQRWNFNLWVAPLSRAVTHNLAKVEVRNIDELHFDCFDPTWQSRANFVLDDVEHNISRFAFCIL